MHSYMAFARGAVQVASFLQNCDPKVSVRVRMRRYNEVVHSLKGHE